MPTEGSCGSFSASRATGGVLLGSAVLRLKHPSYMFSPSFDDNRLTVPVTALAVLLSRMASGKVQD